MEDEPQAQIRAHAAPARRDDCAHPRVPSPAGGRGEPTAPTTPRPRPTRPRAVTKKCRAGHNYSSEPPGPSAEVQGRARFGAFSSGINAVFAHCTPRAPRPVSGRVWSSRPIPSGVARSRPHEVPPALLRPLRLEVPPPPPPRTLHLQWCPVHAGPVGKGAEIPCSGSPALPRSALARSPASVGPQVLES